MDKNIVILDGIIGEDLKFGKTTNGRDYCSFSLRVSNTYDSKIGDTGSVRTHSQQFIRIMVFEDKKKLVSYLKGIQCKKGRRASVLGFISARRVEMKGITFIQNSVVARDVIVGQWSCKQGTSENAETTGGADMDTDVDVVADKEETEEVDIDKG